MLHPFGHSLWLLSDLAPATTHVVRFTPSPSHWLPLFPHWQHLGWKGLIILSLFPGQVEVPSCPGGTASNFQVASLSPARLDLEVGKTFLELFAVSLWKPSLLKALCQAQLANIFALMFDGLYPSQGHFQ